MKNLLSLKVQNYKVKNILPNQKYLHKYLSTIVNNDKEYFKVTVTEVVGKVDYNKLVRQFGTELIDNKLNDKFEKITGREIHPWIKRGIFFTHRSLDKFLDAYSNGEPVFLYTGRGPTSEAMHIGHLIPFLFTKWLQDTFNCPLMIQIADEEKAAFKKKPFHELYKMGFENAKEIIACGFKPDKTFIFSNRDYRLNVKRYEEFVSEMKMQVSMKDIQRIFGLNEDSTIAMYDWPFYQSAAAFYQAYPHVFGNKSAYCLVPHAIDQDPYFRLARDIASKMNLIKPCSIMSTFIPPLTGVQGKMSSSVDTEATLFLSDSEEIVRNKILKYAFSGGGGNGTLEEHRKYGGNPDIDIAYQYLKYFEYDDKVLQDIHDNFKAGRMTCADLKNILIDKIYSLLRQISLNRKKVTKEILDNFYSLKSIELPKNTVSKKVIISEKEKNLLTILDNIGAFYKFNKIDHNDKDKTNDKFSGTFCKVLFLKGSKEYYLYIINNDTIVNMKTLHKSIGIPKVSFGTNDTLEQLLKVSRKYPTIFSLININKLQQEKEIQEILIDNSIDKRRDLTFYSLEPHNIITISYDDMIKFLTSINISIKYI